MLQKSSIVHRIFGSLFGIWTGVVFSKALPPQSWWGFAYLFISILCAGGLAALLHLGFSRKKIEMRRNIYIATIFVFLVMLVVIYALSSMAFTNAPPPVEMWELAFLGFVLIFWPFFVEAVEWANVNVKFRDFEEKVEE